MSTESDKQKRDLLERARGMLVRLGHERTSAFCKAVTHKADFFDAQQLIRELSSELEQLREKHVTQSDSIKALHEQEKKMRAAIGVAQREIEALHNRLFPDGWAIYIGHSTEWKQIAAAIIAKETPDSQKEAKQ